VVFLNFSKLYRKNVSAVVYKDNKYLVLKLRHCYERWWKFPQGGVDANEDLISAARCELKEELGTDKFKLLGVSKYSNIYDWDDVVIKHNNCDYRGQEQKFVFFVFEGTNNDFCHDDCEIIKYKWITKEEILKYASKPENSFRCYNGVLVKILDEFEEFLKST
jgi:putative (di)nucleoside polyphosphate hydrolase